MSAVRRPAVSTPLALVVAIALAGVAGYLISRPQGHVNTAPNLVVSPKPTTDSPFSTYGYSVADDVDTHQVVVFGGNMSPNQTWLWTGADWHLAKPRTSPPGREYAPAEFDPALHLVLLFGGTTPTGAGLNDTWGWDGTTWHELDNGRGGPPPGEAGMAWDPAVNAMVLIGASNSGTDTWTWGKDIG